MIPPKWEYRLVSRYIICHDIPFLNCFDIARPTIYLQVFSNCHKYTKMFSICPKHLHITGPAQFTSMLFKGQNHLIFHKPFCYLLSSLISIVIKKFWMIWILQNLYDTYSRYTKCPTCTWKENALIQCSSPYVSNRSNLIIMFFKSSILTICLLAYSIRYWEKYT